MATFTEQEASVGWAGTQWEPNIFPIKQDFVGLPLCFNQADIGHIVRDGLAHWKTFWQNLRFFTQFPKK